MNFWIFQGNPNQFPVSEYVADNKIVNWSIRQKQYINKAKKDDKVFIWRSDGGR